MVESLHHHTFVSLPSDTHVYYQPINTPDLSAQTNIFTLSCVNALTAPQLYVFEALHTRASYTDLRLHIFLP